MQDELSQLELFVKNCCKFRPEGGKFLFLGVRPEQLNQIEGLNSHWDCEYYDADYASNILDQYPRYHFDLIYIQDVGPNRCPIETAYQWGPKVKGGGALAGWGYQDRQLHEKLLTVIGDCPSKWPDIWALPIVEG